jgi:hypothetical protein
MIPRSPDPRLWFTPPDRERVRGRLRDRDPLTLRLAELARAQVLRGLDGALGRPGGINGRERLVDGEQFLTGCAVHHLLTGDVAAAELGRRAMLAWFQGETGSDLERAAMALKAAMLMESCAAAWSEAHRAEFARLLVQIHEGFRRPGKDNPHSVANNWWGVTHSGALVSALAAHGHRLPDGKMADLSEGIAWARGRLRAFAQHFGDAGLYHEGLGYQCYTVSHLLPALFASRGFDGVDLAAELPQLRRMGPSLFAAMCARPAITDAADDPARYGAMLGWNDAGMSVPQSNVWSLFIALAPESLRGGMRSWFDQIVGVASPDPACAPGAAGWFFHLFHYPFEVPAGDPDAVLPVSVCDSRQGLAIYRNRYRDADDCVLGAYARTTQIGGHSHDDAGSVRFMALGQDWILGGGQARGSAEWQSRITCHPPVEGGKRCGTVLWHEGDRSGAVFGIEMRRVVESYAERYVAARWPQSPAEPVLLAILDQIDDHRSDRDWFWNLTFPRELRCAVRADRAGFSLVAPGGQRLDARFLGDLPTEIHQLRTPESKRRFTTGAEHVYPGLPFLQAAFERKSPLGIYVMMAVTRGDAAAEIERPGRGLSVRAGGVEWARPFGAAVPETFEPGKSRGLSPAPHGKPVA